MAKNQTPEIPKIPTPETAPPVEIKETVEKPAVSIEKPVKKPTEMPKGVIPSTAAPAAPSAPAQKSETLEKVEDIMEEDLEDVYQSMPDDKKKEFRAKGEETAVEIESMLYKVKIHSKKIFKLLFGWLRIIPGVNKYFLKQEAKLKTDEILGLKDELNKRAKD